MKLLIIKQKSTVLFLLTLLILFGTSNIGYAQAIDPPLSERTPQIRNAIVAAVPYVWDAEDVTAAHLAAITKLRISRKNITALKAGDFNGLTALTELHLWENSISDISPLAGLTSLTELHLWKNPVSDISPLKNLTALTELYMDNTSVSDISVLKHLTNLKVINLTNTSVSDISALDDLTSLSTLYIGGTSVSDISALDDSTNLINLDLSGTSISDISALDDLTKLSTFYLENTSVSDISALDDSTNLRWLILKNNSISDISALEGLTSLTDLYLEGNSISDYDPLRRLITTIKGIEDHPGLNLDINIPPLFTEGTSTTRSVAENTASGQNIGAPVSATDVESETLTYNLSGADAASFSIISTSGQLQTRASLDFETKPSYSVTVSVSDGDGGSDSIDVRIDVTDVGENRAPSFAEGTSTTRSVAENTGSGQNIGTAISATDPDTSDTLTYTLGGTDAAAFSINSTNGQLRTNAALDYETKRSYSVRITVSDTKLTSSIDVRISVSNVNEAPSFATSTATRSIAENTAANTNIGTAFTATDVDADTTLTYTLGGSDASSFSINSTNGQLQTRAALDFETKASYSVTITVSDGELTASIDVRITVTDVGENRAPTFAEGTSTTRSVAENTGSGQNIGSAVSATDPDNDTLTYTVGGTDASSFSIVSTNGQLQTRAALDFETKASYLVTITVSDGELTASIDVRITVTDVGENRAPTFAEGTSTTRTIAENTAANTNIGSAVSATDPNDDTLTYTLGGSDASSFSINSTNGQLQTNASLDYETKKVYAVSITVSDSQLTDTIDVTVNVTDINEAPTFSAGATISNISATAGTAITSVTLPEATDVDGNTITYALSPTPPAGLIFTAATRLFAGTPTTETASASYTYTASDGTLSATLTFTIEVSAAPNNAPSFTDGTSTTRTIAENTASAQNIGTAISATDADNDTLTYTLSGTDAAAFSIISTSGQLQTSAALDFETKPSYSVTVSVSDGNGGSDSIPVAISVTNVNEAPSFATSTATRSIAENTAANTNIGTAFTATDVDADTTLTYALSGADAASFGIVSTSGQLQTRASLDFETKASYSVTITVSDGELTASIDVRITVTDVGENRAPTFAEGTSTTRSVAENTGSEQDIGSAVSATDPDDDTLTYTLGGTDAASFSINSTNGQLQTKAALDYETKTSYSVTVSVSDDNGGSDSIDVTITATDANDAPVFTDVARLRVVLVPENTASGTDFGHAVTATDQDNDTLTYSLNGTDAESFRIVSTSGQLRTKAALDYETKSSYSFTISVSDGNGGSDTINIIIRVTNVNEAPNFTDGSSTTRSVAENTASGQNIGTAVAATDVDVDTTLTYTLGGTDATAFSINSSNGQLQTKAALDFETKTSYSVRITVSDGELTASIDVRIDVTDVDENRAPSFAEGTSTTRSVAENTGSGQDIGSAVSATDPGDDTLTYTLGGTDAASFSINSTNGQLQTNASLDYETKKVYAVSITVSDSQLTASIDVSIDVTNVNEAPNFTDGTSTTRTIAENTAANTNIGSAVSATDVDADTTLTYTLGGVDASSFSIISTNGQLQTNAALDFERKRSYSVSITVSDGELTDSIDVRIDITDVDENRAPTFAEGTSTTRSVAENTASEQDIGSAVSAIDADDDTLTYTLSGADAASFSINSTNGQLQTSAALDYETKKVYAVTITVSDTKLTDTIDVTINVSNVNEAPSFATSTATRSIAENTAANTNIGGAFTATDVDADTTLTYTLGGVDASSFSIISTSGQLQTSAALDFETKPSYSVSITVSDGELTDTIDVRIDVTDVDENRAPTFAEGTSTTRSVAEDTGSGQDIGSAVSATDPDDDTLTYTLGGADAASFGIVSTSGQLQTSAALDFETKPSYSVTVSVSDGNGGSDSIDVRIDVTDVGENRAPAFAEGTSTTRSIAENTASGQNIGSAISATDLDTSDTLTYTLSGTDAPMFTINSINGQLQTRAALDYETGTSYSVMVSVSDGKGGRDSIPVRINVMNVNEAPNFTEGSSATRTVAENTVSDTNIGSAVAATDVDADTTLTYTLTGTDAAAFSIVSTSGQLQTSAALDFETKPSYSVTVSVSDGDGGSDSIDVRINVTNVNEAPNFTDGTSTTRTIAENTVSDTNIGSAVAATDVDADTTLTYTLGGADAAAFSIASTSGQLQTLAALDFETKPSYSVTITVSDGELADSIDVRIDVTDVDENSAPSFAEGTSTTRTIAENTAANTNIGTAVSATDPDTEDVLTYTLGGTDASSFSINSTNGQLQTNAALDFETKPSYSVSITVSDTKLTASIDVRINVTNVNEAPSFTDGTSTTRTIAENTASDTNIGSAVAATDVDADTTLTYTLGGADAAAFSIISTSGQLQTSAALDFETKPSYSVTVSVSDGNGGSDSIPVRINVTNVNEAPNFTEGSIATRTVPENKASGTNVGSPVAATDVDANTTLTYTLGGADADTFRIVSTSGQLRTNAALNFESKASYSVTVSVSDGNGGSNSIDVTIDVTDVYEPIIHRTQQVQDAIVAAVPGVNHPDYVTVAHLAAITLLNIADKNITSLKSSDFNELPTLTYLDLSNNSIRDISSLEDLTTLTTLRLESNNIRDISALAGMTSLTYLRLESNSISNISALEGMTNLTTLYLGSNNIRDISALDDLTKLTDLNLSYNSISNISALAGMTKLTNLTLSGTSISNISVLAGMTKLTNLNLSYNSISDISALADLTALIYLELQNSSISDISALADLTALKTLELSNNSIRNVSALEGLTALENLFLKGNPISNYDPLRKLITAIAEIEGHPGLSLDINIPPVFTEGTDTTRSVAENTPPDTNIGAPVSATDVDSYGLTYVLSGTDAGSFNLDGGSGQLQTFAALDFETKRSYSVTVSAIDDDENEASITVTIDVTDVDENRAPAFTDGDTTTRSVAENTAAGQNIGTPVAATDEDGDTLTYTLGGTDAASFSIVSTSGQLQTRAALNYQTKSSYSVTVSVSDGNGGTGSITVTISVTEVSQGLITPVSQRTQEVQEAIVYAVPDVWNADDVTPEHLAAITELHIAYRGITSLKSGDFNGLTALTWLTLEGNSISDIAPLKGLTGLTYLNLGGNSISDIAALKGLTALTELYLWGNSISDIAALKGLTALTILYLENNSISNIASLKGLTALTYLNLSNNSISDIAALEKLTKLTTLNLWGNTISDYDPLRRLMTAIAGIEDHPGLTLDINIPPAFTEGTSTTRSVAEYTTFGKDIGAPVSATDVDSDYLTYSLEGTDAGSFNMDSFTGQLQTAASLHFATKSSYSVTISVSDDWGNTASITVTIKVTDVNEASITPVNRRTQQVQDAIVTQVFGFGVWDADDVTPEHLAAITQLTLSSTGITSLKSGDFSFLNELTELYLADNSISDISALRGLTGLTTLNLSGNNISNISVLEGMTNLRYLYLEGNPISNYDPLRRLIAAIESSEGNPRLNLDINIPPVFTEGTSTTRYVAEYTPPGQDFGAPVSATDANSSDSLNYSLEGMDADAFGVEGGTGQLQTSAALRYQTKSSYSVTVSVSDKNGGTDSINVRIYVRDVNEASITPVNRRTQQVQDAIVDEVSDADNADDVTVAHLAAITRLDLSDEEITSLKSGDFSGLPSLAELHLSENAISDISALRGLTGLTTLYLDDNSISNISALGGLTKLTHLYLSNNSISNISALRGMTKLTDLYLSNNSISNISALEGLTKLARLYLEGNPISDYKPLRRLKAAIEEASNYISIDIDITNNPPQFTNGDSTTRSIAENVEPYTDIGEPISATDTDPNDSLSYDFANGFSDSEAASVFYIDHTSGQLYTIADLDYETKRSYKVIIDVSDGNNGLDRITVTINIRDVAGAAPSVETSPIIPKRTALLTNFPNPFNPETWIPYQLAKPADVTLTIYDVRGVVVRELKLGHQPAGVYHSHSRAIHWDGRNAFGEKVATGIYFYTLQAGDYTATRKLLIRK